MKRVNYLIFILFCCIINISCVFAGTASFSSWSSASVVAIGNSVTITASFSSSKTIFFTEGSMTCTGAGVNKTISLNFDNMDKIYSKKFYLTVKPTSVGKVTCTTKNVKVIDASMNSWQTFKNNTISTTIRAKNTNNNLASLSIDGYALDQEFKSDILEYSVTVKEGTEKIKVNAKVVDGTAKVNGVGNIEVSEGLNDISIVVTAEDGSKKTYKIKVTVLEFEPIKVVVDDNEYTVVRKRKSLPKASEYFSENTVTISDEVIDSYYSEKLGYTLVGLKDNDGLIKYFIYDNGEYTYYNEQVFNGITLRILDKELPNGYIEKKFTYNDSELVGYQEAKLDIIKNTYALTDNEIEGNNFYLFYAINLDTLKEELYQYDLTENTVQRYNTLILDMYRDRSDKYYLYLLGSILLLGVSIILFSIVLMVKGKKRNKKIRFEEGDLF